MWINVGNTFGIFIRSPQRSLSRKVAQRPITYLQSSDSVEVYVRPCVDTELFLEVCLGSLSSLHHVFLCHSTFYHVFSYSVTCIPDV